MKRRYLGIVVVLGPILAGSTGNGSPSCIPNFYPIENEGGIASTYSTEGFVDLESDYATPQGTNGRSCISCHDPRAGWGMTPELAEQLFDESAGLHPMFNARDADISNPDLSTEELRRQAFTMLLQGKFRRNTNMPSNAEFEVIGINDPFNQSTTTRLVHFRRSMPTANFRANCVSWECRNTEATLEEGLKRQIRGNITGAQQGSAPSEELQQSIADFELALSHAQMYVPGVGSTSADGAKGGPYWASLQPLVQGRFDVFDAWEHSWNPKRRQIYRGQELFNEGDANGRRCGGCHNAANNGQNVNGSMFDVGASDPAVANADMAVFTLRNLTTGEVIESTDPGRAMRTGLWSDMNRFKTMNVRGLAARAPYFHGGTAETLADVVTHYEDHLGFDFTDQEEEDLVAFLNAL